MSSTSAGTVKESETVLPVPVSSSDWPAALSARIVLRLQASERQDAANDVAEVLGGLVVAGLGAHRRRQTAVDVAAAANHFTAPSCVATCSGSCAWLVRTSRRPTAHALFDARCR